MIGQLDGFLVGHGYIFLEVNFVGNEDYPDVFVGVFFDDLNPFGDVEERGAFGGIVGDYDDNAASSEDVILAVVALD